MHVKRIFLQFFSIRGLVLGDGSTLQSKWSLCVCLKRFRRMGATFRIGTELKPAGFAAILLDPFKIRTMFNDTDTFVSGI